MTDFESLKTYNRISQAYDQASGFYWKKYSLETVDRLNLQAGEIVLDAASGTGASALHAAGRVGERGRVVAVDFSQNMIARAAANARKMDLQNIRFLIGDMRQIDCMRAQFDVVICVFGLFFVPDMAAQVARLWRLVRPGGRMALTVFGADFLTPVYPYWKTTMVAERPDLVVAPPWERLNAAKIDPLMQESGVTPYECTCTLDRIYLNGPEEWWNIVSTSGLARFLDFLDEAAISNVRAKNIDWLRRHQIESLVVDVIYVMAKKPVI